MSRVREVCSCGAQFDYTSNAWHADADCQFAAKQWREQHHHEPEEPEPESHNIALDTVLERADNEPDRRAELDVRMGFR